MEEALKTFEKWENISAELEENKKRVLREQAKVLRDSELFAYLKKELIQKGQKVGFYQAKNEHELLVGKTIVATTYMIEKIINELITN